MQLWLGAAAIVGGSCAFSMSQANHYHSVASTCLRKDNDNDDDPEEEDDATLEVRLRDPAVTIANQCKRSWY